MDDLFAKAAELVRAGRRFALAVVLDVNGSAPQVTGARAVISESGEIWGTLGGGIAEAEAQRHAVAACASGRPVLLDLELQHEYSREALAICGGHMRVLVDPSAAKDTASYKRATEARQRGERGALVTLVCETPELQVSVHWVPESGLADAPVFPGAECIRACVARGTAQCLASTRGESMLALVEPVVPNPVLLIAGGGHIGQSLAQWGVLLGFDVTVVDDRPEFSDPARFPKGVTAHCRNIPETVAAFPITRDVYIVLVTRGHKHDAEALEACIHSPAAYLGMIGSKRKVAMIRKDFLASGLATEAEFDRIYAPIGLDIGAVTVPEIAASIAAQLVAVRRKGHAARMPNAKEVP